MQFSDIGVTHRGCPFIPYLDLSAEAQHEAKRRFSPDGRKGRWTEITNWAFAVRKDGKLARCPYIEPVY